MTHSGGADRCSGARLVHAIRDTAGGIGGTGQSGTSPKEGGPNYLHRFALEQTVTVNTAAAGGNASLLMQE